MHIVRSFDVNRPGTSIEKLKGGVLGGALVAGKLTIGDEIEVAPGLQVKGRWTPLKSRVTGLQKAGRDLPEAGPGGLLGLLTQLDPALTKADALTGSIAGRDLPQTRSTLSLELRPLQRALEKTETPKAGETLMINVGTARTVGTIKTVKKGLAEVELKLPVVCETGGRAVLSRRIAERWRLIGLGIVK